MNLDVFVTNDCNMGCTFCGAWKQDEPPRHLTLAKARKVLAAGKDYGFRYTTISGGEPFLHQDLLDIIDYADAKGYYINITTNGLMVTPAVLARLANKKVNIRVSLHTLRRSLHEKITGTDTLDRVLETVRLLKERHAFFSLGSTIYEDNLEEIDRLARFARDSSASFIRFTPVVSVFKGRGVQLDRTFYQAMLSRIVAAALAHRDVLNYQRQKATFVGDPLDIVTTRRCPAGSNLFMIVDTNETIIPCQFMPLQLDFPRIIFRSIDDFSRMKKAMDSLYSDELVANLEGDCGECGFKATCAGGCIGSKVTNGLALTAEQPLCIRGILRAVLEQCTRREIDDLTHYWYYHYCQRVSRNDRNRSCMRKLPIWELNFRYSGVPSTDGGPSQPVGM